MTLQSGSRPRRLDTPLHLLTFSRRRSAARIVLAAIVLVAGACTSDEAGGTTVGRAARDAGPTPVIAPSPVPYVPSPVPSDAGISGTVLLLGEVPEGVTVRPTMSQRICGTEVVDRTVSVRDGRLADVVVWLTDIRSGRQLPLSRRFAVTNSRCLLEPRVQAVTTGGTLNVRNSDPIPQRTRILRHFTRSTLAVIDHSDFGQVVPDDRVLESPGLLELTSDLHPWTHGWIAVFDHPYFAVTGTNGAFSLEGVPPGSYTLAAWHERFGRMEQKVTVGAGEQVAITVTFRSAAEGSDSTLSMTGLAGGG